MKSLDKDHLGGCILNDSVGDINTWSPCLWDSLITLTKAKSIIDVGCGVGYSLNYFINKGIDGFGIEGLEEVLQYSNVANNIVIHDYTKGAYIPNCNIDLAWSCEFVEHVEEKYKENFMKTFNKCNYVAMTHALPGQVGYHHVNTQHPKYWIDCFGDYGFYYMESESEELKSCLNDKSYGHWIKNSFMLFKKINLFK